MSRSGTALLLCTAASLALTAPRLSEAGDTSVYVDDLVLRAQGKDLGLSKQWLRLGYWRESLLGGFASEVDGPFFLAKTGATDPRAELEATVRAFFRPAQGDTHPRCVYPARFRWLSRQLGIDPRRVPQKKCPKLERWTANLQAQSATLVFSSYYLNNAASAFGHTFLRINRKAESGDGERQALLDTGINYAATQTTSNAFLYAFQGLFGMFRGQFTALPYFYKVREYNDFESRDLWEYELSLSAEALGMLIDHIWELGSTHFAYWYLSENCSYHILTTLEAADPSFALVDKLHWPVIPADTIKAISKQPGLIRKVDFRPSARAQLEARTRSMTARQRALVAELASKPSMALPVSMTLRERVRVLDAAADLIDIRHAKELVHTGKATPGARLKQELLARRAELGVASEPLEVQPPLDKLPHRGHESYRAGVGGGYGSSRGGFTSVRMRLALHDLVDSSYGYPDTTRLEFLPTTVRFWVPDGDLALESLYFVRVASLSPLSRFNLNMSWKVDVGLRRVFDDGCDACLSADVDLGGGFTLGLWGDRVMLYAMSDVFVGYGRKVDGALGTKARAGLGPAGGLRVRFAPELIMLATGSWHWLPDQPSLAAWASRATLRWLFTANMALELAGGVNNRETETGGSWLVYF